MDIKRVRVLGKKKPSYPDVNEVNLERRAFLRKMGGGLLGVSLLGLGACDETKPELPGTDSVPDDSVDMTLQGVAPDVQEPDVQEWELAGGMREPDEISQPDVPIEPDYVTGGVAPPPDEISQDVVESLDVKLDEVDVPPLAGDMPAPDIWTGSDVVQDTATPDVLEDAGSAGDVESDVPPLAGDLPAPRFSRKR